MAITLRDVRGIEDINFNFQLLAQALSNISPEQIGAGAISAGQINGDYMPRAGGAFLGAVSGTDLSMTGKTALANVEASGSVKAASGEISGTFKAAVIKVADKDVALKEAATPGLMGLVKMALDVGDLDITAAATYSQGQITQLITAYNALLAALRTAGVMDTDE